MCGIAGFLTGGQAPDRRLLTRMCDRLRHRGPDASGSFFGPTAALGHRRLAIIDLAGGAQPLGNEDGSVQIVFNGEIYNFAALRDGLERRGHRFATNSDTETIVHLYEEEGERVGEFLNGMYAFAIWDSRRDELLLCRDRLGKKPLYYSLDIPGQRCAFASELKALAVMPGFDSSLDAEALADFLALSYVPDPRTIYRGVRKLPPAHTLIIGRDGARLRRYWEPVFREEKMDEGEAQAEVARLASDAVRCRLMSDVPLGAFLSGGIDSSAAVGLMAEHSPGRVKTFSIGFSDPRFDELEYARLAARQHRTDHRELVVTPRIDEMLEVLSRQFDEPFGDASAIPTLYLSRMTREHVTVALSGDGADEIFGGYRRYRFGAAEEAIRGRLPRWGRRLAAAAGRRYPKFDYLPRIFRGRTLLTNLGDNLADSYFTSMSTFRDGALDAALSPETRARLGGYSPRAAYTARFRRFSHLDALQQMQAVDLETYLPGDILVKADRATMAYSLEGRSPWLDYRLVELACRMPSSLKLRSGTGKHIFRRALGKHLPAAVARRPKMGFSTPMASWLRGPLRPAFEARVFDGEMRAWLDFPEIRRLWAEHQGGFHNHERKLWNLLTLAAWRAHHHAPHEAALAGAGRER
jgi:asparagine synthase (glutamine-hydrolysing)